MGLGNACLPGGNRGGNGWDRRSERRSSDRHRPRSGRNSRASFRRMAPSPKGSGAATTARATSASPSLFRVPATGRNGAGSFAAARRDAGVKPPPGELADAPHRIRIFMPGWRAARERRSSDRHPRSAGPRNGRAAPHPRRLPVPGRSLRSPAGEQHRYVGVESREAGVKGCDAAVRAEGVSSRRAPPPRRRRPTKSRGVVFGFDLLHRLGGHQFPS